MIRPGPVRVMQCGTAHVEAGKTKCVREEIGMGTTKARNFAVLMDDEKGRKELAKCHPFIPTEKK
jgi:hypothetical protein